MSQPNYTSNENDNTVITEWRQGRPCPKCGGRELSYEGKSVVSLWEYLVRDNAICSDSDHADGFWIGNVQIECTDCGHKFIWDTGRHVSWDWVEEI